MAKFKGDQNIGQYVAGDVLAGRVVFYVGGEPTLLAELDDEQLRLLRRQMYLSARKRREFASLPMVLWLVLVYLAWLPIPAALRELPLDGAPVGMVHVAVMLGFAGGIALLMHGYFGSWRRRQKMVASRLERLMADVDAEMDVREAHQPQSVLRWIRSLAASFRP